MKTLRLGAIMVVIFTIGTTTTLAATTVRVGEPSPYDECTKTRCTGTCEYTCTHALTADRCAAFKKLCTTGVGGSVTGSIVKDGDVYTCKVSVKRGKLLQCPNLPPRVGPLIPINGDVASTSPSAPSTHATATQPTREALQQKLNLLLYVQSVLHGLPTSYATSPSFLQAINMIMGL